MKRSGMSLIEVLLAIFLVAGGIATTAFMFPMASRGLTRSKLTMQAAWFAQHRMEEALVRPGADVREVHPEVPELTGEIQRLPFQHGLTLLRVVVYRTHDPVQRPLATLESTI